MLHVWASASVIQYNVDGNTVFCGFFETRLPLQSVILQCLFYLYFLVNISENALLLSEFRTNRKPQVNASKNGYILICTYAGIAVLECMPLNNLTESPAECRL